MLEPHVSKALRESDRRVVVTGATGWLGRATLDLLRECLGDDFTSRVRCFGSQHRVIDVGEGCSIEQQPLSEIALLPPRPTLILHFAFLTKDRAEAMDDAEYRLAIGRISSTVLDALDSIGADGVFVASSGAARLADDPAASPAMRLYGTLKRDHEEAFAGWGRRSGKAVAIARIFNLSGPHINKHGSYALACFILDALSGGPVTVKATHKVERGYVAIRELISLVFAVLLEGKAGPAIFDTGGEPMEMGEIAEAVAKELGGCAVERAPMVEDRANTYLGNDAEYRLLLRRYRIECVPFAQQIVETAQFLANKQQLPTTIGLASDARSC